jgi:8-oxo-dGTP pyrophosphatase MutT (NUDIX family)
MQRRESSDELDGCLEFPGGKIEKDEKPIAAAIREVAEETGVLLSEANLQLATIFKNNQIQNSPSLYIFVCSGDELFENNWYPYLDKESFWPLIPPANREFLDDIIQNVKSSV